MVFETRRSSTFFNTLLENINRHSVSIIGVLQRVISKNLYRVFV